MVSRTLFRGGGGERQLWELPGKAGPDQGVGGPEGGVGQHAGGEHGDH